MNARGASDRGAGARAVRDRALRNEAETVAERLRQLDCDPIAGMVKLAQDEALPAVLRARVFAELARYIVPHRKAVDLTGTDGGPLDFETGFNMSALSDQELETLVVLLKKGEVPGS